MAKRSSIRDLWSAKDRRDLELFADRARGNDLAGALHAIEGVDRRVEAKDNRLLDTWAGKVLGVLSSESATEAPEQHEALARVLGMEAGFRGDLDDYYSPENSLFHHVLVRRRGMPILLSSIWMVVGHRAGLPVSGIGLPGHFLVRIGKDPGVLSDPFHGGVSISIDECKRRVKDVSGGKITWNSAFLSPLPVDRILERVLRNLVSSFRQHSDLGGTFRSSSYLCALRPDVPEYLLQKAQAASTVGADDIARSLYEELVVRFPASEEAETALEALEGGETDDILN
jgi:regulator of sirC expression with transglutaminase-like and TPR domain